MTHAPRWLGPRVLVGATIVLGLLAAVVLAWWTRGVDEASRLFQLLQGVILGTLAWLHGTHGLERAEATALHEARARARVEEAASGAHADVEDLVEELARLRAVIDALKDDPGMRRKVETLLAEMKGG